MIDPQLAIIVVAVLVNSPVIIGAVVAWRKFRADQAVAKVKALEDARNADLQRQKLMNDLSVQVLEQANNELDKYKARVENLEKELSKALDLNEQFRNEKRDSYAKLLEVEAQLAAANKRIAELEARDVERNSEMAALRSSMNQDKITRDKVIEALTEKVAALESDRAELQKQLAERDKVIDNLQQQITQLKRGQTSGGLLTR